ncbi:MAG: hypothetical protein HYX69_15975 [Planctomycetia bacterium]|nr:hypothetical protein [Planctomycetia bacterium]
MRRPSYCTLGLALLGLLLTSCIPTSEQPLSRVDEAQQDPRLYGVWMHKEDQPSEFAQVVHIGAEAEKPLVPGREKPEPGLMQLVCISHHKEGERWRVEAPLVMRFFVSKIGEDSFINGYVPFDAPPAEKSDEGSGYLFIKYEVVGDEIHVWYPNLKAAAAAIESGALTGKVKRERGEVQSAVFTDTTAHLAEFLKNGGIKKLFLEESKNTYCRVR